MTKEVHQHINAPVFGPVAGGDITIDTTVHVHSTVYTVASHSPMYWVMGALVFLVACGVAVSQVLLPDKPNFSAPSVPMVPVQSSAIKAVGYDPQTHHLFIDFVASKHTYTYCNVPMDLYEGMMAAKSKGGYYHQWLFNGKYGC